ncbi:MAG: hydrolase, partial [Paenibacillaceae bacterium]|nr:hydrolase [Paenibacillaceae bacterium]
MNVIFECAVKKGHTPRQPDTPDPMQTGVKWVPLTDLNKIILYPNISDHIVQYAANRRNIELIEDHRLKRYTLE